MDLVLPMRLRFSPSSIPVQHSGFAQRRSVTAVPCVGNLYQRWFALDGFGYVPIKLGPKTLSVKAGILANVGKQQGIESGTLGTIDAASRFWQERLVVLCERRGVQF